MSTPQNGSSTTTIIQTAVNENTDKRDIGGFLRRQVQQSLAFGTLVVLFIFFSVASPNFLTWSNVSGILLSTAVIGILALGTTFVIITGGIDLSLGTGMALCSVMTGVFITNMGLPVFVGVIGGIATGVLMGLVNGVNITFLRLPPFIATLAMMMIAGGLALVISGVAPIYFSSSAPDFKQIALGTLIPGLPNAVLITLVLAVIAYLVLSKTLLGRYTFAIGSNEEATRLSGVNTRRWTIFVYMFAGAFTGIAGVIIASRLDSAQPQIGTGYELQAIAAVIIGGTSLLGGRGSILGTVIGALIMSVLVNGLRIMSIQSEWQNIVVGVVILIAVFFDSLRNRART
ncbi:MULTISPECIES: ABC transporter permease [Microbacterium]|jgi:ribose transport system permease protein|uniref:ABC transporter permease n=1 Tax=Microbacterium galbinum TaxID=2851646 RepID=A0ABY4ILV1_9MICO|nr:ABC transporter permease [Microbacterium galbinum]MBQ3358012.1 ABC transporter permease [Microbacterium sp.]MCK2023830.1 ABC transporter permease [Microbacterium galbinum]MCK2030538.1 ABC transporter permease [Microbacterium galbinum]UPL13755.1 ABC transporter permease [Microbacterium galbinum]